MTEVDVDEVNVPPVPEPEEEDEGFMDPDDTYTEGRPPVLSEHTSEGFEKLPEIDPRAYGPDSTPLEEG